MEPAAESGPCRLGAAALTDLGVTADLSSIGFGENQPVASNDTNAGRQQNRRVEIFIPAF